MTMKIGIANLDNRTGDTLQVETDKSHPNVMIVGTPDIAGLPK